LRQSDSKITASDLWGVHDALDFIQASPRNLGIRMHKPKHITVRGAAASIHLYRTIALAHDELIAKASREINGAVRAAAVCNNNIRSRRSFAQMLKK
jgi:hypothetical protein